MNFMFEGCKNLSAINLSKFNTENVSYMNHMFDECKSLNELNLSSFKMRNHVNMFQMFHECTEELKLKIKNEYGNIINNNAFY